VGRTGHPQRQRDLHFLGKLYPSRGRVPSKQHERRTGTTGSAARRGLHFDHLLMCQSGVTILPHSLLGALNNLRDEARVAFESQRSLTRGRWEMKRRKGKQQENAVARAIEAVGGPTKAATLCEVSNTAVHRWKEFRSVPLLRHALPLSRASGIPIEEFVGDEDDRSQRKISISSES
jgi:hypothetical protein